MTDIWYTRMDNIPEGNILRYRNELEAEMQEEILRYRLETDRNSRVLARKMVSLFLKIKKKQTGPLHFLLDKNKKPYLPKGPYFNISHSGNYVMVGFSKMPLGVDVEEKRAIDWELISEQFHEEEKGFIASGENALDNFYRVWARKEAFLKATGIGILRGLSSVNALPEMIVYEDRNWYVYDLEIDTGYAAAYCVPKPQPHELNLKNVNLILK